jgi:hypothetical protein
MSLSTLSSESLLRYYESIRQQVEADRAFVESDPRYGFVQGAGLKEYAAAIYRELRERGVGVFPIAW